MFFLNFEIWEYLYFYVVFNLTIRSKSCIDEYQKLCRSRKIKFSDRLNRMYHIFYLPGWEYIAFWWTVFNTNFVNIHNVDDKRTENSWRWWFSKWWCWWCCFSSYIKTSGRCSPSLSVRSATSIAGCKTICGFFNSITIWIIGIRIEAI